MNNEIEEKKFGAKFGKFCGKCERERKFVAFTLMRENDLGLKHGIGERVCKIKVNY